MRIDQVAVILFTYREFLKTPEEVQSTLEKIADIGYQAIQISGMSEDVLPPEEIKKRADDLGLKICGTHEPSDKILEEPEAVIERLRALGTKFTAYPFPKNVDFFDPASIKQVLEKLENATQLMSKEGITLCYHNHAVEFIKQDGKPFYARLFEETSIQAELDTYWVQAGGASPLGWIQCLQGRLPLLHLKDMRVVSNSEQQFAEIGAGNLDFHSIIPAAERAGCQWFIVEQDNCYDRTPFEATRDSFLHLKNHLCSDH